VRDDLAGDHCRTPLLAAVTQRQPRRLGRVRAVLSLARAALRVPVWLTCSLPQRRCHEAAFFGDITSGFGLTVERLGEISDHPGTLFIMNHISWADIAVMLTLLDADFVARSDMQHWPVIGRLARRFGPVFVDRTRNHDSGKQVDAIRDRLASGRSVILCAEGTTSLGESILPFRTSLFAAADSACVVQPVVLTYLAPDGTALPQRRQREVAWIGDDDLLTGAARVAREHTLAQVIFLPPVAARANRKALAETIRHAMLTAYAAALNRPR
jgi:1-acyl-sn-glycerol-3-phosphate acyltransferase